MLQNFLTSPKNSHFFQEEIIIHKFGVYKWENMTMFTTGKGYSGCFHSYRELHMLFSPSVKEEHNEVRLPAVPVPQDIN